MLLPDDPDIRRMDLSSRWLWVVLLARAKSNGDTGHIERYDVAELANVAVLTEEEVSKGLALFVSLGWAEVTEKEGTLSIFLPKYDPWQAGDTPTDTLRKRAYRARLKQSRTVPGTVPGTVPDSPMMDLNVLSVPGTVPSVDRIDRRDRIDRKNPPLSPPEPPKATPPDPKDSATVRGLTRELLHNPTPERRAEIMSLLGNR